MFINIQETVKKNLRKFNKYPRMCTRKFKGIFINIQGSVLRLSLRDVHKYERNFSKAKFKECS